MRSNPTTQTASFLEEWIDGATIQRAGDGDGSATGGFAWSLYDRNLHLLKELIPIIAEASVSPPNRSLKSLKESLGNLFLWGDGFRDGKMERVLDESDDLRETVMTSLVGIGRLLISKLAGSPGLGTQEKDGDDIRYLVNELEILLEQAKVVTEDDFESDGGSEIETQQSSNNDAYLRAINSLSTYITCLMDLLPSMEDILTYADRVNSDEQVCKMVNFQASGPARTYILNIYDRFSKADSRLVERLGEANWQRHLSLRNLVLKGQEVPAEVVEAPKSIFNPVSLFQDSGLGASLPATNSSYAATIASHSSFVSSLADAEGGSLRVPPTPKEVGKGIPFTCEICGHLLSQIKNRVDWKRHVFSDLKPYICTASSCEDALRTFPTRKMWETHEFEKHHFDSTWACSQCPLSFFFPDEWQDHLRITHRLLLDDSQIAAAIRTAQGRKPHPPESIQCPLCLCVPGKSKRNWATHVGRHFESIALAALPRENGSDSEFESERDSRTHSTVSVEQWGHAGGLTPPTRSRGKGDHRIRCICDYADDDVEQSILLCMKACHTWQHTGCYYPSGDRYDTQRHSCVNCELRKVLIQDKVKANSFQWSLRREKIEKGKELLGHDKTRKENEEKLRSLMEDADSEDEELVNSARKKTFDPTGGASRGARSSMYRFDKMITMMEDDDTEEGSFTVAQKIRVKMPLTLLEQARLYDAARNPALVQKPIWTGIEPFLREAGVDTMKYSGEQWMKWFFEFYAELDKAEKSGIARISTQKKPVKYDEGHLTKISGGRKRGKRKVLKKKTVKDDEGYLVTREEAVWESFSEDEPAPHTSTKENSSQPRILAEKIHGSQKMYLVAQSESPDDWPIWEPAESMSPLFQLVAEWEERKIRESQGIYQPFDLAQFEAKIKIPYPEKEALDVQETVPNYPSRGRSASITGLLSGEEDSWEGIKPPLTNIPSSKGPSSIRSGAGSADWSWLATVQDQDDKKDGEQEQAHADDASLPDTDVGQYSDDGPIMASRGRAATLQSSRTSSLLNTMKKGKYADSKLNSKRDDWIEILDHEESKRIKSQIRKKIPGPKARESREKQTRESENLAQAGHSYLGPDSKDMGADGEHNTPWESDVFYCSINGCSKIYTYEKDLLNHEILDHNDQSYSENIAETFPVVDPDTSTPADVATKMYKCIRCGTVFETLNKLDHHMLQDELCQKLSDKFAAQSHGISPGYPPDLRQKQNDRPFKCDHCLQTFNRNHDLHRHKRIHLAVKPFPCPHCDKSFSRKDALKRHILVKGCGKSLTNGPSTNRGSQPPVDTYEGMSDSSYDEAVKKFRFGQRSGPEKRAKLETERNRSVEEENKVRETVTEWAGAEEDRRMNDSVGDAVGLGEVLGEGGEKGV